MQGAAADVSVSDTEAGPPHNKDWGSQSLLAINVAVSVMLCCSQEPYAIADTVPAVLRQADTDGDGRLSFEEFAALIQVGIS